MSFSRCELDDQVRASPREIDPSGYHLPKRGHVIKEVYNINNSKIEECGNGKDYPEGGESMKSLLLGRPAELHIYISLKMKCVHSIN